LRALDAALFGELQVLPSYPPCLAKNRQLLLGADGHVDPAGEAY
jgi:hypothetical protein